MTVADPKNRCVHAGNSRWERIWTVVVTSAARPLGLVNARAKNTLPASSGTMTAP